MKEILFISGKGGTGKTSLTSSFIQLADNCIACDYVLNILVYGRKQFLLY